MGSSESPSLKDELAFFIVRSPDAVQILVNELVTRPPFLWTSIEIASLGWLTWMEKFMSGKLIGPRQRSLSKSMCRDPGSQTSQRYFGHLVSLRQGFMTLIGPQVSKPICVALSFSPKHHWFTASFCRHQTHARYLAWLATADISIDIARRPLRIGAGPIRRRPLEESTDGLLRAEFG